MLYIIEQILLVKVGQFASLVYCWPPSFLKFNEWLALQSPLLKNGGFMKQKTLTSVNLDFDRAKNV